MILDQNHTLFQTQAQVEKILAPLTKASGINYFSYGVNYPDKTLFGVSTHANYIKDSLDRKFPFHGFYLNDGWHQWGTYQSEEQLELGANLGIGNGVIFIKNHGDKREIFEFGASPESTQMPNFYLNNLNTLKKFMVYFWQEAKDIIQMASENRVKPAYDVARNIQDVKLHQESENIYQMITATAPIASLSKREKECFLLLIKGYSISDISEELSIAVPTIANYISRIKQKIKCHSKKEMVNLARELNLVEYYTAEVN